MTLDDNCRTTIICLAKSSFTRLYTDEKLRISKTSYHSQEGYIDKWAIQLLIIANRYIHQERANKHKG